MYELVDEAEAILTNKERDLDDFGRLLDLTWKIKKVQVVQSALEALMNCIKRE